MKVYPVKFEAYDEVSEGMFTVEAFDEHCATVSIDGPVDYNLWVQIDTAVRKCLVEMFPEKHGGKG